MTDPKEKHSTSGGFKIPQGNYGKNNQSLLTKPDLKENIPEKANLSRKEMMKHLGVADQIETDNEFLEEPFTDSQLLETIKNKRDIADLVINNIEKNIGKIQMHREHLKIVLFFSPIFF